MKHFNIKNILLTILGLLVTFALLQVYFMYSAGETLKSFITKDNTTTDVFATYKVLEKNLNAGDQKKIVSYFEILKSKESSVADVLCATLISNLIIQKAYVQKLGKGKEVNKALKNYYNYKVEDATFKKLLSIYNAKWKSGLEKEESKTLFNQSTLNTNKLDFISKNAYESYYTNILDKLDATENKLKLQKYENDHPEELIQYTKNLTDAITNHTKIPTKPYAFYFME